jgi:plastocyanin
MSRATRTLGLLGISLAIVACAGEGSGSPDDSASAPGGADEPPSTTSSPTTGAPAAEPFAGETGTVRGTVRYAGAVPEPRSFVPEGDAAVCGAAKRVIAVDLAPGGALRDAVVTLAAPASGGPPPDGGALLDQSGCEFVPHVIVARVGETVRVRNSDPLTHNVHTAAFDNRTVNRMQPAGGDDLELTFDAPERIRVQCDIHPWMSAWIIVTDHPWAAVTGEDGGFELPGVPAGERSVEVWQEALGEETRSVSVAPGDVTDLAIELSGRDRE